MPLVAWFYVCVCVCVYLNQIFIWLDLGLPFSVSFLFVWSFWFSKVSLLLSSSLGLVKYFYFIRFFFFSFVVVIEIVICTFTFSVYFGTVLLDQHCSISHRLLHNNIVTLEYGSILPPTSPLGCYCHLLNLHSESYNGDIIFDLKFFVF